MILEPSISLVSSVATDRTSLRCSPMSLNALSLSADKARMLVRRLCHCTIAVSRVLRVLFMASLQIRLPDNMSGKPVCDKLNSAEEILPITGKVASMDNLALMRVFAKVVETGGLSAVGRALDFAPPTITRRINELEDLLGVRLLHRSTRKLSLTEAGEIYYERSRSIVQAVEEANLAVTEKRAAPSGTLRVTAPSSIARRHVTPAIAEFQTQYPNVRIVMRVADRRVDIVDEGLDIAIRTGRLEDSSLIARKLGVARRLVCASSAYLKRAGRPKHPEELCNHACLTFRTHPGSNLWRFRDGGEIIEVRASGPFIADNGETLVAGACAGLGLVLAPEWLVGMEISSGALEAVLTDCAADPANTPLYSVYPSGPYVSPKVRVFVDFLADRFSRAYAWSDRH